MTAPKSSDVRSWAKKQGVRVSDRGPLPQDLVSEYENAHRTDSTAKSSRPAKGTTGARAATRKDKPKATQVARPKDRPGTAPTSSVPPVSDVTALEVRVAELEEQVMSLTQRLDAAVTALTRRGRAFPLPRRK